MIDLGFGEVIEALIQNGYDVNFNDKVGWIPLHTACAFGQEEIADILIQKGANVSLTDNNGWTPLYVAATSGISTNHSHSNIPI